MKKIAHALLALLLLAAPGVAFAEVGQTPSGQGPGLVDGGWLYGVRNGQNFSYQYNITAAGTNQATASPLPTNKYLMQVDTVAAGTGVYMNTCLAGVSYIVFNNGANALTVYPNPVNNLLTGAQDTINGTTSVSVASKTMEIFACPKNGVWAAK